MISSSLLLADLTTAKNAKVSPIIIQAMEIEYAKKKFNTDQEIAYESEAVFELDPMYGLTDDDKMIRLSNNGVTELDYIISCNIIQFVKRASKDEELFYKLKYEQQMEIMKKFAMEVQEANKNKATIIDTSMGGL